MVDLVRGTVVYKYPDSISVLCGSFALRVFVPLRVLTEVKEGDTVELFTKLILPPEGTPTLYGFKTLGERSLFETLLKIPKVGAKVAMSIISHFSKEELEAIVSAGDVKALSSVPGLGKKLSERIILELRGKLERSVEVPEELMEVLLSLGYSKKEIVVKLKGVNLSGLTLEEAVKLAVQKLSGRET
ncbi:Holliday junction branch migration protein RuvA [Phorcysia thermohydrogeniphila]|uniref:Holliday junction branch migration complex subunit RuvA n=1 Tax=Phorcysia thermohydrogeniphila TaxID=936138 RepID=A0A4V2PDC7_9BACT|nr:Holliday junction branch migration protein RuvA [Phorcysia thermohydrogeniphila]TCK04636.1 Holliday junction DNA helicase subunit RuvA [Phorcysia thermohydrogeniphila]